MDLCRREKNLETS